MGEEKAGPVPVIPRFGCNRERNIKTFMLRQDASCQESVRHRWTSAGAESIKAAALGRKRSIEYAGDLSPGQPPYFAEWLTARGCCERGKMPGHLSVSRLFSALG